MENRIGNVWPCQRAPAGWRQGTCARAPQRSKGSARKAALQACSSSTSIGWLAGLAGSSTGSSYWQLLLARHACAPARPGRRARACLASRSCQCQSLPGIPEPARSASPFRLVGLQAWRAVFSVQPLLLWEVLGHALWCQLAGAL